MSWQYCKSLVVAVAVCSMLFSPNKTAIAAAERASFRGFLAAGGSVGLSPDSSVPSVSPALSMLDRRSLTSTCTAPLTSSVANLRCLCLGSRNDVMYATFCTLLTSAGPSFLSSETDTVLLNPLTLAFSPGIYLRCLDSKVMVTGYTMEMDTSYSPHKAVVAHFSECNTGKTSSITIQLSSVNSRVRASDSLVTLLSDKAAHTA